MAAIKLTRSHRILVAIVLAGALVIASIGFVGSYAAVRDLAERKGFGGFSPFFPIGIDAGIVVLLSLDLLLTWLRIPFPLLRQTAWLLTAATIAFNGAAAWGDPLGVGMHAIIPVLFVITVEAARHAVGRISDITADKHMEGVRIWRWFLSPVPTFRLWRRMKLWELRSYEEVIGLERDRLVYQARLRAEFGRAWRRRAPVEARMPLKLARYGVPLHETAGVGLAALAGPPERPAASRNTAVSLPGPRTPTPKAADDAPPGAPEEPWATWADSPAEAERPRRSKPAGDRAEAGNETWWTGELTAREQPEREPEPAMQGADPVTVPVAPGRRRVLGNAPLGGGPRPAAPEEAPREGTPPAGPYEDPAVRNERFYNAYREYAVDYGALPNARQLSKFLNERYGDTDPDGALLGEQYLREFTRDFKERYTAELETGR